MNWTIPVSSLLVLVLVASGWGGPSQSSVVEPDSDRPHTVGFQATYYDSMWDKEMNFSFTHVDEVMDADGQLYEAYALTYQYSGSDDWTTRFLDEELVTFRIGFLGQCFPGDCVGNAWLSWAPPNLPNSLGLDVLGQVTKNGTAWYMHGTERIVVEFETEEVEEGTWYRVVPDSIPPDLQWYYNALLFSEDKMAPLEVIGGPVEAPNQKLTLVHYQEEGQLPVIENPRREREPIDPPPRDGLMFPGEDEDTFDIGYSHRELVEGLVLHEQIYGQGKMKRMLDEGACIVQYEAFPRNREGPGFDKDPVGEIRWQWFHYRSNILVELQEPGDTTLHEWTATVKALDSPEPLYSNMDYTTWERDSTYCPEGNERSWPEMHLGDAFSQAEDLIDDRHEFMGVVYWYRPNQAGGKQTSPEDGWNQYDFLYKPENAGLFFLPYEAYFNADRSELIRVETGEDDVSFPPVPWPPS